MCWFRPVRLRIYGAICFLFWLVALRAAPAGVATPVTAFADQSNPAKNLARTNCGATIDIIGPDGKAGKVNGKNSPAAALLLDDNTLSYPLQEGDTTVVISFPKTSDLDRFTFMNESEAAAGEMTIAVSNYRLPAQSRKWNQVAAATSFTGKRLFNVSLAGTQARFVKLSFHVSKGGPIAAFGLYGAESLERFGARQRGPTRVINTAVSRRLEDMLNFNFANLYARARVVFISSGLEESARRMIDDDVVTSFEFAPTDPHPTVIVELGERERLHRVSAVYKMEKGRLDVFLLQEMGTDPSDLSGAKPVASVTDSTGSGKAALDFNPAGARYVALRWTPADRNTTRGFELAEVSAFGEMPLSMLSTAELPDIYAENSAALVSPPVVVTVPVVQVLSQ